MLFNRHMFKYYMKYSWMYLLGIAALIAVDYVQLWIPEFLGDIVNIIKDKPLDAEAQMQHILIMLLVVAVFSNFIKSVSLTVSYPSQITK